MLISVLNIRLCIGTYGVPQTIEGSRRGQIKISIVREALG